MFQIDGGTVWATHPSGSTKLLGRSRVSELPFPAPADARAAVIAVAPDSSADRRFQACTDSSRPREGIAGTSRGPRGYGYPRPVGCGLMVAEPRAKRRRHRLFRDERRVPAMVVERIEQDAQYQRLLAVVLERTSALERVLGPEQLGAWLHLEDALLEWVHLLQHRYFVAGTRMRGWRRPSRRPRH